MSAYFWKVPTRRFPVALGDLTFYACEWKLSGVRQHMEQGGVNGSHFITNASSRAKRLILEGRFCFLDEPSEVLIPLDTALAENTRFSFSLRGVRYVAASLVGYTISEAAEEGVLPCRLTLVVSNVLTPAPTETEAVT